MYYLFRKFNDIKACYYSRFRYDWNRNEIENLKLLLEVQINEKSL